jgi:hypothetical protein
MLLHGTGVTPSSLPVEVGTTRPSSGRYGKIHYRCTVLPYYTDVPSIRENSVPDLRARMVQTGLEDYSNLEDTTVELRGHTDSVRERAYLMSVC